MSNNAKEAKEHMQALMYVQGHPEGALLLFCPLLACGKYVLVCSKRKTKLVRVAKTKPNYITLDTVDGHNPNKRQNWKPPLQGEKQEKKTY